MNKILYICIQDNKLKEEYQKKVDEHNEKLKNNDYMDSGFDLLNPVECITDKPTYFIDYKISCAMYEVSKEKDDKLDNKFKNYKPTAFYLYPRSSISKTNFRLANNVGIIDSGYRGNIGAYFDCKCNTKIVKNQRLLQICSNTLEPFYVVLVDNLNITERGKNGFGSSGL